ncbi:MAG: T9SS type A sorting domain-containing protein [Calditrichaeota bacterium]|nr:T9SS type A sorting domain-containing protein [Calditrichota bacterium]MCB9369028.1 T9SS type A sorting domain-containing protein [Calditrichota bacterium]
MAAVPGFPMIEETDQVHFLYRAEATSVMIPGDMNNWSPDSDVMTRISGTDLWYRSKLLEHDARLDYKFVVNNSNWILDPLNPNTVTGGFGPNSELRMPGFVQPLEIINYPDIDHGSLRDTMFTSEFLGNTRRVRVYTPFGYDPDSDCYPFLLVHDGLDYINLGSATRILDYLIYHGQITPLIAVFVPAVNRNPEYTGNQQAAFGRFITEELLPWIDEEYNTCSAPQSRGSAGASNGGNISLWLAVTYPEVFGLVLAQSPFVQSSITDTLAIRDDLGLKFYLDIGTYDIPQLIPLTENLHELLQTQNYQQFYQFHHDGHSWGNWRAHFDEALLYLYPAQTSSEPRTGELADEFSLSQNFPNPFNPSTTLTLNLTRRSYVSLTVYNLQGQVVDTLAKEVLESGSFDFVFDGAGLPSGIYFARLTAGQITQTVKMILLK